MVFRRKSHIYKSASELEAMLPASLLNQKALAAVMEHIKPGVTTLELDAIAESVIRDGGGRPNFAEVPGYRHTVCANVNDTVVHGIPDNRPLEPGDIVTIDCGAIVDEWHSDAARTVVIPAENSSRFSSRKKLSDVTEEAMWAGVAAIASASHLNEVGAAIEKSIRSNSKFGIASEYIGHGIGREMHEDPPVFNTAAKGAGPAVKPGLVVCVEPIITEGAPGTRTLSDGWTVKTLDGKDACQWENMVMVHEQGIWVPTEPDGGMNRLARYGVIPVPLTA